VQVLNSKLGITLRVSVTSATILSVKKTLQLLAVRKIAVVTETRNVIPSLKFKTCSIKKS